MNKKPSKEQIPTILLSVFIAILLWTMAMSSSDPIVYEKLNTIPIQINGAEALNDNDLVIINEYTKDLSITFYGRNGAIENINKNDVKAYIDIADISKAGNYQKEIIVSGIPEGVNILYQSAKSVDITTDIMKTKDFTPKLIPSGTPAGSNVLGEYYSSTKTVRAISNKETIERISYVAASFSVKGKTKDFSSEATLKAYDVNNAEVTNVSFEPKTLIVYAKMKTASSLTINPITTGTVASGYKVTKITLTPSKADVVIDTSLTATISSINTKPISITGRSESFEINTKLDLPEGVSLSNSEEVFGVKVTIEPILETSYTFSSVTLSGEKDTYSYSLENFENVTVTVTGAKSEIEKLTRDKITLSANVSSLASGTHSAKITCKVDGNLTVKSISPSVVNVNVKEK